ncbi:MAG: hypothetical protein R3D29_11300 [Nitratireductor sp.]
MINSFSGLFDYVENIENVIGSQGNDTIVGVADTTSIDAQGGNDRVVIHSAPANPVIQLDFDGGSGVDIFDLSNVTMTVESLAILDLFWQYGNSFHDLDNFESIWGANNVGVTETLIGNNGNNELRGNGGNDILQGGLGGFDQLFGGIGDDIFNVSIHDNADPDTIDGGANFDTLRLLTSSISPTSLQFANSTLVSLEQVQVTDGGGNPTSGNMIVTFGGHQFGPGIASNAQFVGSNGTERILITMGSATSLDLSGLTFQSWLAGSGYDVEITGDGNAETIRGSILNDQILGGGGADFIDGSLGDDFLDGGGGDNTVTYASAGSAVTVTLANQTSAQNTIGAGTDNLRNFSHLTGSDYSDTLSGTTGANIIRGGKGEDTIDGGGNYTSGIEQLLGEDGNDTITRRHSSTADTTTYDGGTDIDTLVGFDLLNNAVVDFENGEIRITAFARL